MFELDQILAGVARAGGDVQEGAQERPHQDRKKLLETEASFCLQVTSIRDAER